MAKPSWKSSPAKAPRHRRGIEKKAPRPKPVVEKGAAKEDNSKSQPAIMPRMVWRGGRLPEKTGQVLHVEPSDHYTLVDSGDGRKLERIGGLLVDRPEGQAIWTKGLAKEEWQNADAVFTGDRDEEGAGRWRFKDGAQSETWPLTWNDIPHWGRFTSFRHIGVFPEQDRHWRDMQTIIRTAGRQLSVLNLFGYTGLASLAAAKAGAQVTHVDASKKAIGWARENQSLAGCGDSPIRWICEDAVRFCERETRRGNRYDIILLDPPAFGRGPKGETWQLFDHLPHLMDLVRLLQSESPALTILTSYAIRASSFAMHELLQEVFAGLEGEIHSGELVLRHEDGARHLSTSMFCRFVGKEFSL